MAEGSLSNHSRGQGSVGSALPNVRPSRKRLFWFELVGAQDVDLVADLGAVLATTVKNDRRTVFGWAMYDWANSAYITTAGAIVSAYFGAVIVPDEGYLGYSAQTIWSAVIGAGAAILFLIMPVLGAVADYHAAKKKFLLWFAILGIVATMLASLPSAGAVPLFLFIFMISNIGFVAANVFYDGFLPDITTDDTIDAVSSKGYAFGYIGGGLYIALAFVLISLADSGVVDLSVETASRIGIFGSGVWWLGFLIIPMRRLPDEGDATPLPAELAGLPPLWGYFKLGFGRTIGTWKKLLGFRQILLFVIAYMFYNDATQTVINISGSYAEDELRISQTDIIIAFLIVQFVAFGGAFFFGWLARRINVKNAILVSLVAWFGLVMYGFVLPEEDPMAFFLLAAGIGTVLGGTQALSRSLYATMVPEEASAEFFGFFTVFSKFSAIWGPWTFAAVSAFTGSGRPAILSIAIFLVIGFVLLLRVNVSEARRSRSDWHFSGAEVS